MAEAELYTHAQPPTVKLGAGRSASARAEFLRLKWETVREWCARTTVVRALLPVGGQVAIGQVITGQTLVFHDTSAVENRQREPWESAHVDLVGRQTRRRADGVVVSEFYVGQMQVPIVLSPRRRPPQPRAVGRPGYPVRAHCGTGLCTGLCVIFYLLCVVLVLLCFFV